MTPYNLRNMVRLASLFGVISIGVAFVIITGGIDLSIGSTIGLTGCLLSLFMNKHGMSVPASLMLVMFFALLIGLTHGLLITKMKLQPFIVTLCGLLIYRGLARWLTGDETQGFGQDRAELLKVANGTLQIGSFELPYPFFVTLAIAIVAAIFLNRTIWGRYLLALGRNEQAARFSGINTDRMVILAYVICAGLGGVGGILFALEINSLQPSAQGNFYELYAIAGAVLGGCSLRGGEGSILGVLIGTVLIIVLRNAVNMTKFATQLEFAIMGMVILFGVMTDEIVRRVALNRRAAKSAADVAQTPPAVIETK
jgi:ribose transport system permease protein